MRRQKLRTLMTTFGIFWGTCSIVLLFAFGSGMSDQVIKSQKGIGENISIVWGGRTSQEFRGLPSGRRIRLTESDAELVKTRARTLAGVSPEYSRWNVTLKYGSNTLLQNIIGVWPEFGEMRNLIPDAGSRFINDRDIAERRRVTFIGDILKNELFGEEEAVGKAILVNGVPFTVVGVMKPKDQDSSYNGRDNRKVVIPSSTFHAMYSQRYMNDMIIQSKEEFSMEQSKKELYEILGARFRFDAEDDEALSIWDTTEGVTFLKNFFLAFQMFLVGIGVATLITGAIGVSNIMNVVLEERTKEIGIKMALGAKKGMILMQFIFETLLITGIGGALGFVFAVGLVAVFPSLGLEEYIGVPKVDLMIGIIASVLLGIVGLLAGIFPARRAANLQPVQALKLF